MDWGIDLPVPKNLSIAKREIGGAGMHLRMTEYPARYVVQSTLRVPSVEQEETSREVFSQPFSIVILDSRTNVQALLACVLVREGHTRIPQALAYIQNRLQRALQTYFTIGEPQENHDGELLNLRNYKKPADLATIYYFPIHRIPEEDDLEEAVA